MSGMQIDVRERYLRGSCLIITAAVSGMRRSELMELGMGCRSESRHRGRRTPLQAAE